MCEHSLKSHFLWDNVTTVGSCLPAQMVSEAFNQRILRFNVGHTLAVLWGFVPFDISWSAVAHTKWSGRSNGSLIDRMYISGVNIGLIAPHTDAGEKKKGLYLDRLMHVNPWWCEPRYSWHQCVTLTMVSTCFYDCLYWWKDFWI